MKHLGPAWIVICCACGVSLAQEARERPIQNGPLASRLQQATQGYQTRQQARESRLSAVDKVSQKNPDLQGLAELERVKTLIEGEEDRARVNEEMAGVFTGHALNVEREGREVEDFASRRQKQILDLRNQIEKLQARRSELALALTNLALQPPTAENTSLMRHLDAELSAIDPSQELLAAQLAQAEQEILGAAADARKLTEISEACRKQAAAYAADARSARENAVRLANRMEFVLMREKVTALSRDTGNVITIAPRFAAHPSIERALTSLGSGDPAPKSDEEIANLRDCIRRTGNLEACRRKGGEQ